MDHLEIIKHSHSQRHRSMIKPYKFWKLPNTDDKFAFNYSFSNIFLLSTQADEGF